MTQENKPQVIASSKGVLNYTINAFEDGRVIIEHEDSDVIKMILLCGSAKHLNEVEAYSKQTKEKAFNSSIKSKITTARYIVTKLAGAFAQKFIAAEFNRREKDTGILEEAK